MKPTDIAHSCCPGKRDINAPSFEWKNVLQVRQGWLHEYICKGCKTVIFVLMPRHDKD